MSGLTVTVNGAGSSDDYGIASYVWDWGDGNASTGITASHTYSAKTTTLELTSLMGAPIISAGPPGPPYNILGHTLDVNGSALPDCTVVITDLTHVGTTTLLSDSTGFYLVDLGSFVAYSNGDVIQITATKGTLSGTAEGVVDTNQPYLVLDVTLISIAPPPFDVTITLTVTDTIGRREAQVRASVGLPLKPLPECLYPHQHRGNGLERPH